MSRDEVRCGGGVVLAEAGGEKTGERVLLARGVVGSAWEDGWVSIREQGIDMWRDENDWIGFVFLVGGQFGRRLLRRTRTFLKLLELCDAVFTSREDDAGLQVYLVSLFVREAAYVAP